MAVDVYERWGAIVFAVKVELVRAYAVSKAGHRDLYKRAAPADGATMGSRTPRYSRQRRNNSATVAPAPDGGGAGNGDGDGGVAGVEATDADDERGDGGDSASGDPRKSLTRNRRSSSPHGAGHENRAARLTVAMEPTSDGDDSGPGGGGSDFEASPMWDPFGNLNDSFVTPHQPQLHGGAGSVEHEAGPAPSTTAAPAAGGEGGAFRTTTHSSREGDEGRGQPSSAGRTALVLNPGPGLRLRSGDLVFIIALNEFSALEIAKESAGEHLPPVRELHSGMGHPSKEEQSTPGVAPATTDAPAVVTGVPRPLVHAKSAPEAISASAKLAASGGSPEDAEEPAAQPSGAGVGAMRANDHGAPPTIAVASSPAPSNGSRRRMKLTPLAVDHLAPPVAAPLAMPASVSGADTGKHFFNHARARRRRHRRRHMAPTPPLHSAAGGVGAGAGAGAGVEDRASGKHGRAVVITDAFAHAEVHNGLNFQEHTILVPGASLPSAHLFVTALRDTPKHRWRDIVVLAPNIDRDAWSKLERFPHVYVCCAVCILLRPHTHLTRGQS